MFLLSKIKASLYDNEFISSSFKSLKKTIFISVLTLIFFLLKLFSNFSILLLFLDNISLNNFLVEIGSESFFELKLKELVLHFIIFLFLCATLIIFKFFIIFYNI